MDLQDCARFATENPVCYVASMDGGQPRVRGFLTWYAENSGFYFITISLPAVSRQLRENPQVEVCFYNHPARLKDAQQMRVMGEAEFLDDEQVKEKAYQTPAFRDMIAGQSLRPFTQVFRISTGEAHFWTLANNVQEPGVERLQF